MTGNPEPSPRAERDHTERPLPAPPAAHKPPELPQYDPARLRRGGRYAAQGAGPNAYPAPERFFPGDEVALRAWITWARLDLDERIDETLPFEQTSLGAILGAVTATVITSATEKLYLGIVTALVAMVVALCSVAYLGRRDHPDITAVRLRLARYEHRLAELEHVARSNTYQAPAAPPAPKSRQRASPWFLGWYRRRLSWRDHH